MMRCVSASDIAYLTPEGRARLEIDRMLLAAGWVVQDASRVNLAASRGVAVREFVLKSPHGRVDYLLFVDGRAVGVLEAKKETRGSGSGSSSTALPLAVISARQVVP